MIFDAGTKEGRPPFGSPYLDATVMLPPDYTVGSPMTLRVNLLVDDDPCSIELRRNYAYISRDGLGNVDNDGGSVSEAIGPDVTVSFPAVVGRASRTVDFTIDAPGTIRLQPGDAMSLGLFFGAATTCTSADVHAAMLLYS